VPFLKLRALLNIENCHVLLAALQNLVYLGGVYYFGLRQRQIDRRTDAMIVFRMGKDVGKVSPDGKRISGTGKDRENKPRITRINTDQKNSYPCSSVCIRG
jgi:hypothetical protein